MLSGSVTSRTSSPSAAMPAMTRWTRASYVGRLNGSSTRPSLLDRSRSGRIRRHRLVQDVQALEQELLVDRERRQQADDVVVAAGLEDDHAAPVALLDHS